MTEITRGSVLETVLSILSKMDEDGELEVEITPETWLVADMGLESIDVVVLGTAVQEHYHMSMPFAEFLAEVGQRETRDIQVREFVDFVVRHLNGMG